ncbi:MAG: LAGLIDADG family homing endonuclease [Patescibacteria group bacterium]
MNITADYIRGLVDGEGCFSFCNVPTKGKTGNKLKLPTFIIHMHERDKELIEKVRDYLGVRDKVYVLKAYSLDGFKRGKTARLMIRDFGEIRDIVIPFFYNKLIGYKGKQFVIWLEKIGQDPDIHPSYKVLYSLYKRGYFENKVPRIAMRTIITTD